MTDIVDAALAMRAIFQRPTLACRNCLREGIRGLAYFSEPICTACAPYAGGLPMIASDAEIEALRAGGDAGGEYLDGIKKTDLAKLSEVEWGTFLEKVLEGYSEHMREAAKETPPF